MVNETLLKYFSYYLKKGKSKKELEKESLTKRYNYREIEEAFEELDRRGTNEIVHRVTPKKPKKKSKIKIFLFILAVLILLIVIAVILLVFLKKPAESGGLTKVENAEFEVVKMDVGILKKSRLNNSEELLDYFELNPGEKEKAKKISENLKNCKNTEIEFYGDNIRLTGYMHIKDNGNEYCTIIYKPYYILSCAYKKEQIKRYHNAFIEPKFLEVSAPIFYREMIDYSVSQNLADMYAIIKLSDEQIKESLEKPFLGETITCNIY